MIGLYILSFFISVLVCGLRLLRYSDDMDIVYKNNAEKKDIISFIYLFGFVNFVLGLGGIIFGSTFLVGIQNSYFKLSSIFILLGFIIIGIFYNVVITRFLCKDRNRIKQIFDCKKRLMEIESQLKNIDTMKEAITYDYTLLKEDRLKQVEELNKSQIVLKKAYSEIVSGLNALQLVGTFQVINEYNLTEETNGELQRQIDIFQATKELKGEM